MNREKIYLTMKNSGITGIVTGSIIIVAGIVTGILMIVSGARLLIQRKDVIF